MSSFFTLPASQRKRKRSQVAEKHAGKSTAPPKRREERDESISGSEGSDDEAGRERNDGFFEASEDEDEDEQYQNEDPAAKRIRLAEQYLLNTQREVLDDAGFDAADVDRENLAQRMGDRLKEDTAESKGKLYRWMANDLDWGRAEQKVARTDGNSMTSVAMQGRYIYTVDKDMAISKWELPDHQMPAVNGKQIGRQRSKPKRVKYTRGNRKGKNDRDFLHHSNAILCIAASDDGKFVATGGMDKRLLIWDAATLKPLKAFTQHRDAVTSLAFRRGTNQLFSASRDRTVKIWSLDELAYVETLFGHQDEVVDVSALAQEKCVTVGARDRTARHWKVVEESQLVFRGGGAPGGRNKHDRSANAAQPNGIESAENKAYNEGSMDRVACLDDDTFVTGSDNGSLSLWSIHKKKAVFTYPLAHGLDPPLSATLLSAEENPDASQVQGEPQPRWITALRAIPFSNVLVTGSWDGVVRAWQITEDKRRIEALGPLGRHSDNNEQDVPTVPNTPTTAESPGAQLSQEMQQAILLESQILSQPQSQAQLPAGKKPIVGVISDLAIIDRGERAKEGVLVAAAVGKEHRLGRWSRMHEGKNALVLFEVPRKVSAPAGEVDGLGGEGVKTNGVEAGAEKEDFAGFD
ncbi:pre-rRNA processing protein [Recurvomyces mirabilis]|uniref:Pre-rRNA processing protein n=1 Tax=Recurvomyces mirabilis TaxID=574656 RepID=A0AAE1C4P6_9PEZI|nr:pre-rRNA processing protein [Recurvomyces mirabilis]KAK5157523.1 pre-rRNA processing protein [Recurvomyces mirabilis]